MKGVLTLIPTPIDDVSPLHPISKSLLEQAYKKGDIICVEEEKEGRRRWLRFGLPKEAIEQFHLYNEHTRKHKLEELMAFLKTGRNVFLMSDCGLPAFCDPGQCLVDRCHQSRIKVTSAPFENSVILAMALSGFPHHRFIFEGFIAVDEKERIQSLKTILKRNDVSILMDTPYRLKKLLEQMVAINPEREICLALELNKESEKIMRGKVSEINEQIGKDKLEFI
jgi:16S rRNA (cytidine1402-2'-O)-methyltransferase